MEVNPIDLALASEEQANCQQVPLAERHYFSRLLSKLSRILVGPPPTFNRAIADAEISNEIMTYGFSRITIVPSAESIPMKTPR